MCGHIISKNKSTQKYNVPIKKKIGISIHVFFSVFKVNTWYTELSPPAFSTSEFTGTLATQPRLQYRMFRTMKDDGSHRGPRDPHTHSNTDARVSFLPPPLWDPKMFCVMCNGFSFVFHVSWQNYLGAWHRQSDMQRVDALDKHQLPLT